VAAAELGAAVVADLDLEPERLGALPTKSLVRVPETSVQGHLNWGTFHFREIATRFIGRDGGYTRILRTRNRRGDNAELAYIELVTRDPRVGRKAVPAAPVADAGVSVDSPVRAEAPRSRKEGEEGGEG
jgi:hypothetical protein